MLHPTEAGLGRGWETAARPHQVFTVKP